MGMKGGGRMSEFSRVLKELRIGRGMTQMGLASMLGVSKSAIGMYEAGARQPGIPMLEAIANFFGVDMNFLLSVESTPNKFELQEEYLSFAREMQDRRARPADIRAAIAILEMLGK
jgi:transcriptional regulator with XRE-family HTH domain